MRSGNVEQFQREPKQHMLRLIKMYYRECFVQGQPCTIDHMTSDCCGFMLHGFASTSGFRDGEGRPGGVREGAALGGASVPDSAGADLMCGE